MVGCGGVDRKFFNNDGEIAQLPKYEIQVTGRLYYDDLQRILWFFKQINENIIEISNKGDYYRIMTGKINGPLDGAGRIFNIRIDGKDIVIIGIQSWVS